MFRAVRRRYPFRPLLVTAAPAAAMFTVAFLILTTARLGHAQNSDSIGPAADERDWVPLTAEYVRTFPDGAVRHFVRYRSSDGSLRLEQTESGDVQITNSRLAAVFRFRRQTGLWTRAPRAAASTGDRAFLRRNKSRSRIGEVDYDDVRVRAVREAGLGMSVFEFADAGGRRVYCPEFNMLEVFSRRSDGMTEQLTTILAGEPSVAFEPPPGAAVSVAGPRKRR